MRRRKKGDKINIAQLLTPNYVSKVKVKMWNEVKRVGLRSKDKSFDLFIALNGA